MPNSPRSFRPGGHKPGRKPWQQSGPDRRSDFRGRKRYEAKRRILIRDECECQVCGKLVDETDSKLDHIIPLSRGGTHDDSNLRTMCDACHTKKTQRESQG